MKYFFLFCAILISSCTNCEYLEDMHREDECLLIVEKIPGSREVYFKYEGTNPNTHKKCDCESGTSYRWWNLYREEIEIGDTIIKEGGELIFSIHKKDTVLKFNWECKGKTYK